MKNGLIRKRGEKLKKAKLKDELLKRVTMDIHEVERSLGGFVDSLNGAMDRSRWPSGRLARVSEVAEAAAIMRVAGAPVRLWSLDCEAFYKQMGRQNAQLWRVAMMRESGVQVDSRCCFGSAADAAKCSVCGASLVS